MTSMRNKNLSLNEPFRTLLHLLSELQKEEQKKNPNSIQDASVWEKLTQSFQDSLN